jgi:hypothetical protein
VTATVTELEPVPPAPVQLNMNVLPVVSALVESEPEVASAPDHAPLAVQLVALVDDQVRVLEPPLVTLVGLALIVTVGAGGAVTVTVADCVAVPPAPEQLRVNVLLVVREPVERPLPEVA